MTIYSSFFIYIFCALCKKYNVSNWYEQICLWASAITIIVVSVAICQSNYVLGYNLILVYDQYLQEKYIKFLQIVI